MSFEAKRFRRCSGRTQSGGKKDREREREREREVTKKEEVIMRKKRMVIWGWVMIYVREKREKHTYVEGKSERQRPT